MHVTCAQLPAARALCLLKHTPTQTRCTSPGNQTHQALSCTLTAPVDTTCLAARCVKQNQVATLNGCSVSLNNGLCCRADASLTCASTLNATTAHNQLVAKLYGLQHCQHNHSCCYGNCKKPLPVPEATSPQIALRAVSGPSNKRWHTAVPCCCHWPDSMPAAAH
jgi:hypothetical protein